jgi:hypothetical protein
MNQVVGSILVIIGNIWVTVSTCGMVVIVGLLWVAGFLWILGSWGGIIFAILWLMMGLGLVGLIVGIASLPVRLLGAGMIVIGEALKNPASNIDGTRDTYDCAACGRARVSEDDQYCRSCGQSYG